MRDERSASRGFVLEHPWMTFFLAMAAIHGVAAVATAVAMPREAWQPRQPRRPVLPPLPQSMVPPHHVGRYGWEDGF